MFAVPIVPTMVLRFDSTVEIWLGGEPNEPVVFIDWNDEWVVGADIPLTVIAGGNVIYGTAPIANLVSAGHGQLLGDCVRVHVSFANGPSGHRYVILQGVGSAQDVEVRLNIASQFEERIGQIAAS